MTKPLAWSYSALNQFENCPRQFNLVRRLRHVKDEMGADAKHGTYVHEALDKRAQGKALPPDLQLYEPMMARLTSLPVDKILPEKEYTFNDKFQLTSWFGHDAWLRAKLDLQLVQGDHSIAFDYKTGKRKQDIEQLRLFAGIVMTADRTIKKVTTGFIWLKELDKDGNPKVDTDVFTTADVKGIWADFLTRYRRMQVAAETDTFPPRPSGLCGKWCPVPHSMCEYSGRMK